ncbi:uncharacterized protein Bfra_010635ld [Botrytis fragariae]|uniref:RING-type domain-containing protein n=1 Tax=Botrytis fragariae TaxID=1964551 RepID=A0A8H6ED10_9HELO|nr:uncharacterized protein Bfra_010635ld [Botrytis fragariae]KAF5867663.1 hypothetical protein Bfra_010635ld [Botrytis fragariae]
MSSGQSNISATEELERSRQQNTSGNAGSPVAESLALHPRHQVTVLVDGTPQVTASQGTFRQDVNSQEFAENIGPVDILEGEGHPGNLTEAGSQLNNHALTLQEDILQDEVPADITSYNTPGDTERSAPADNEELSGGLTDDERSGTPPQNVVPQDAAVEDIESIHAEIRTRFNQYIQIRFPEGLMDSRHVVEALVFYTQQLNERNGSGTALASTIEIHDGIPVQTTSIETMDSFHDFYASIRPRQSHANIQENHRNQAIDELLTPVLIDETQTESILCPICNEKYDSSTANGISHGACMVPGCKHVFGRECINMWLKEEKKSTCPMCRAEIDIPTDSSDDDDDD